jgi:hypothetical protein
MCSFLQTLASAFRGSAAHLGPVLWGGTRPLASLGHIVYSDNAPNAVRLTQDWLRTWGWQARWRWRYDSAVAWCFSWRDELMPSAKPASADRQAIDQVRTCCPATSSRN